MYKQREGLPMTIGLLIGLAGIAVLGVVGVVLAMVRKK